MRVSQMTNDRVNLSDAGRAASSSTIPFAREAPALFFDSAQHRYLAWTSRPSGWRANAAELFSTDDLLHGRWTSEGNPTRSSTSFNSQAAAILPLPINSTQRSAGQRFLYVADRCVVLRPPCTSSSLPSPLLCSSPLQPAGLTLSSTHRRAAVTFGYLSLWRKVKCKTCCCCRALAGAPGV